MEFIQQAAIVGEVVSYCESVFDFKDQDICATATSGVIDQQGRPFTHGYEIHLERATLQFEYAALSSDDELMPLKVIRDDGTVTAVEIENGDPVNAFVNEIQTVVDSVRENKPSEILGGELARDAIAICHAQAKSVHERRFVELAEISS